MFYIQGGVIIHCVFEDNSRDRVFVLKEIGFQLEWKENDKSWNSFIYKHAFLEALGDECR